MQAGGQRPLSITDKLRSGKDSGKIAGEFERTGSAHEVHGGLSAAAESLVAGFFRETIEPALPQAAAVLAVGEFGRRELYPYSSVEVAVIFESEPMRESRDEVARFARSLWEADVALSCSPRSIAECLEYRESDADLALALLDHRLVAGDAALLEQFESRLPGFLSRHGRKLCDRLGEQARTRHTKFGNAIHHLEPDVLEGPGGLLDARLVKYLTRLRPGDVHDAGALDAAESFLASARCFLHYRSGANRNTMTADALESVVRQPYARAATPADWMRTYYAHSRAIWSEARRALETSERLGTSLLDRFRDRRSQLSNAEFSVVRERIYIKNPSQLESDPATLMRLAEFVSRHGTPPAAETERRLEAARGALLVWYAQIPPEWNALKTILSGPHAHLALRSLDDAGLMPALFPEWGEIADLAVMDRPESRYSVDEQTLIAVERLAALRSAGEGGQKRFAGLLSEIDGPALLILAILYHGMGRAPGAAESSARAAALALQAADRMRMSDEERATLAFLIDRQRELSEATSGRDLDDPTAARQLADRIGTVERLKLLAALSYADLASADPGPATAWRLEQLWRSYTAAIAELTRELETDRILEAPPDLAGAAEFVKGFPTRYLRARFREIAEHVRLYEQSRPTGAALELERVEGAWKLTVVARDMPGLFASLAGAISSFGLDILKAEAFSNAKGVILDTFVFLDPKRTLELNPQELDRLRDLIRRVALGKTDARRLLRDRIAPDPKKRLTAPLVRFDSQACDTATLVEIIAEDRLGLLYSLASAFSASGCNIDVVLIDTKGHRAIDVFYVTSEGKKLTPDMEARLEEKLIAACG